MGVIGIGVGTAKMGRICKDKAGNVTEQSTARWDADPHRRIGGDLANGPGEDGTERAGGGVRRLGRGRLSPPGGGTDPPKPADQHTGPGGHDPSRRKAGEDICTYCPDYNCRDCIVNEWKEDPDDE